MIHFGSCMRQHIQFNSFLVSERFYNSKIIHSQEIVSYNRFPKKSSVITLDVSKEKFWHTQASQILLKTIILKFCFPFNFEKEEIDRSNDGSLMIKIGRIAINLPSELNYASFILVLSNWACRRCVCIS